LALTAASTLVGTVGAINSGQAQKQQAEYQAQVARNNQQTAAQNAQYASAAGETQAQAQDFKSRAALGAIEAAQGASGLSLDSPTLRDVRRDAGQVLRLDTQNIAQNAALRSRAYTGQASNFGAEAGLQQMAGRDAERGSYMKAAGTLLSGASSFSEKWTKFS
jgi:hypothetical protein